MRVNILDIAALAFMVLAATILLTVAFNERVRQVFIPRDSPQEETHKKIKLFKMSGAGLVACALAYTLSFLLG